MADVIKTLTEAGLCSEVYHKELYLRAAALSGAGPQLPAVCNPRRTPPLLASCAVEAELGHSP